MERDGRLRVAAEHRSGRVESVKSKTIYRPIRRGIGAPVLIGACVAASILPGAILAESFGDNAPMSQSRQSGSVDIAAVAPSYDLSPDGSGIREIEYKEPAAPVAAPVYKRPAFDMSHVERIRVRVWGNQELSGDYAIDPDFSLSFPRIGRIEIGNMTPADLEQMLAAKLSGLARTDITVAVEVAKFRPYFIMGQVAEAGAMEWKPGLKVIQAISLARGVMRSSTETAGVGSVHSVANRQSKSQLTYTLAQLARLKAEREGTDIEAVTERISSLIKSTPEADRTALTALVSRQNDMLSEQRDMMETQLIGLRREREAAQREVEAAETQKRAVLGQLDMTRSQIAAVESLKNKQLISNSRFFEQKSQLLSAEVRAAEANSMVERARARLSNVEQQLVMVPQQRRAVLSERIDSLERDVAQLELASGTHLDGQQDDVLKLQYHIARESSAGLQTIPATVFTEIMPGDVVIVSEGQTTPGAVADSSTRSSVKSGKDANAAEATQRMIEDAAIEPSAIIRRTSSSTRDLGNRPNY
jgi:protein involved in polysaccharide export with SLBB domain